MGGKIAIVITSGLDQRAKVMSGLHVAKRIHDARKENSILRISSMARFGVENLEHR